VEAPRALEAAAPPAPPAHEPARSADARGSVFFETAEAESELDPMLLIRLQETLEKFGARGPPCPSFRQMRKVADG